MDREQAEFRKKYAELGIPELLALGRAYDSLIESAQAALRAEFARRGMEPPLIAELEVAPATRSLVTVRRYRDLTDAIVARSMLESAGIAVYLRDENLVRLDWQVSNFIGGIRLQVDAADERNADELLSQPVPEFIAFGGEADFAQPHCPVCQSSDVTFEGASRGAALALLYVLSLPLPSGQKTWVCNHCEARWKDSAV